MVTPKLTSEQLAAKRGREIELLQDQVIGLGSMIKAMQDRMQGYFETGGVYKET